MRKSGTRARLPRVLAGLLPLLLTGGHARAQASAPVPTTPITVVSPPPYASQAQFHSSDASLGPRPILTTPQSVTVIPQDLLVDQQIRTVNDALRDLPSVEIRDQQGLKVSRPQSRGFQGTITENTRLDGLNVIGTTAIATENLEDSRS